MADDLNVADSPNGLSHEDLVALRDGAADGRPAGIPSSYDHGRSIRWTPKDIADIHAMSRLGRYQIRGFTTANRRMANWNDLVFVPATATRLPLEGYRESCETKTVLGDRPGLVSQPIELDIPIYIASMSFGALSASAKTALGRGASKVGTMTCSGEGGMLPEEREASKTMVYQMTPSRYGLDLEHLRQADGIEIVIGQGAKPGTGGLLLGMKISDRVARMRSLPVGVDQRSTVRHPDFLGADDLLIKIEELREATGYRIPIFVKLGATRPRFDVAMAAKVADVIVLDGAEGWHRRLSRIAAGPHRHTHHDGHPRRPGSPGGKRHVERGEIGSGRGDSQRHRCGQGSRPGGRRGDDRNRRPDGAGLQLAPVSGGLSEDRHLTGKVSPLSHRTLPGGDHHPGSRAGDSSSYRRRRRPGGSLSDRHDHGDHHAGQGVRQIKRPQPGNRRPARPVTRFLGPHRGQVGRSGPPLHLVGLSLTNSGRGLYLLFAE